MVNSWSRKSRCFPVVAAGAGSSRLGTLLPQELAPGKRGCFSCSWWGRSSEEALVVLVSEPMAEAAGAHQAETVGASPGQ